MVREAGRVLGREEDVVALGSALAAAARPGLSLHLRGELGAGKTTLTRGIARGLGHRGAVKSPTYTLVEPYERLTIPLYHFDLYRLGDPEELEFLGLRDYFSGNALVVVEWPQRGEGMLPPADLVLTLTVQADGRAALLQAGTAAGEAWLDRLVEAGVVGAHGEAAVREA